MNTLTREQCAAKLRVVKMLYEIVPKIGWIEFEKIMKEQKFIMVITENKPTISDSINTHEYPYRNKAKP